MGNYSHFCFSAVLKKDCPQEIIESLKSAFNRKSQYEPAGFPYGKDFLNYLYQGKIVSLDDGYLDGGYQLVKIDCQYRGFYKRAIEFVEWLAPYISFFGFGYVSCDTGRIILFLRESDMDCNLELLFFGKINSEQYIEQYE